MTYGERYASILSALCYVATHLSGDYPLTMYRVASRCILSCTILFACGLIAVPAALIA